MATRKTSPAADYSQFALVAAGAALLSSVVTGSLFPLVIVGIALSLLYGFVSGILSGGVAKARRRFA
jgi:hypothetical protein